MIRRVDLLAKYFRMRQDIRSDFDSELVVVIECMSDDDPRIVQMAEAGYFDGGAFEPGPEASNMIGDLGSISYFDVEAAEDILTTLARSAVVDQAYPEGVDWRRPNDYPLPRHIDTYPF